MFDNFFCLLLSMTPNFCNSCFMSSFCKGFKYYVREVFSISHPKTQIYNQIFLFNFADYVIPKATIERFTSIYSLTFNLFYDSKLLNYLILLQFFVFLFMKLLESKNEKRNIKNDYIKSCCVLLKIYKLIIFEWLWTCVELSCTANYRRQLFDCD